jgi:hypothetical protein
MNAHILFLLATRAQGRIGKTKSVSIAVNEMTNRFRGEAGKNVLSRLPGQENDMRGCLKR